MTLTAGVTKGWHREGLTFCRNCGTAGHTTKGHKSIQLVTAKGGLLKKAKRLHLTHYIKVA